MTISVIVPTLNEESCIAQTLHELRRERPYQIIVVDGQSTDATARLAQQADVLIQGPRGRAAQMNRGAREATGDVLLFLHADCSLEDGALADVERCLANRGVIAGCFTMTVRAHGWWYRSIGRAASARVRLTGLAYGDQGLFLRRADFIRLGGFPHFGLMEDLFFGRKLWNHGRIVVSPRRVFVSSRRWEHTGWLRQTLRNWTLTALAFGGVHPDRLAKFYPAVR